MFFENLLQTSSEDPNLRSKLLAFLHIVDALQDPKHRSQAYLHLGRCLESINPLAAVHCYGLAMVWGLSKDFTQENLNRLLDSLGIDKSRWPELLTKGS